MPEVQRIAQYEGEPRGQVPRRHHRRQRRGVPGCNHCGWTDGAAYNNNKGDGAAFNIIATYDYVDENGALLFQVCRTADKTFPQRRPNSNGGWTWGTKGIRKVLFHLNEVMEAIANDHPIFVVEGEKDVLSCERIGIVATCNPGGANEPGSKPKWLKEHSEALRGADIIVVLPGYAHADAICRMSAGVVKSVHTVKLADHWPDCPKRGDISDWLEAGHTREQLDALVAGAQPWAAPSETANPINPMPSDIDDDRRPPEFTDEALALHFAEVHADDLRFVAAWGKWLFWNGRKWEFDDTLKAFNFARKICRQASAECNKERIARDIAKAKTVAAVEKLARADRRLAATIDQWDADPWLLNTPAGVVDLRTGKTRPHDLNDYMTNITARRAGQQLPDTDLDCILRPRHRRQDRASRFPAARVGLQPPHGGSTQEHAMFFNHGDGGANGKTTFLNTVSGIALDYHKTAPIETFTASHTDRHPTDLAGLHRAAAW